MRIGISGVAGFLGSHLARYLADQGCEVYGIDNESIGNKANVPSNIKYAKIDMRNASDMQSLVEEAQCKIWIHLAAYAHEGLSQFCPQLITENNYNIFLNLITPAINNGLEKFITFSSMSVYGDQVPPFTEEMLTKPVDVYAVAKAAMEKTLEILAKVNNFSYTIIRPHNVYGPNQSLRDPYRNVVGIMMNRIMKNQPIIIYGSGEQTRSFTYVDDVTPYIAKAVFLPTTDGEIINIGPIESFSINHLAKTILDVSKKEKLQPLHFPDRPQEVKNAYCSNEKAIRILGYKTSVTLEEGIEKMWTWAQQQGPQEFQYLESLEIQNNLTPKTWTEKLI